MDACAADALLATGRVRNFPRDASARCGRRRHCAGLTTAYLLAGRAS
jgi:hypothetical protein